VNLFTVGITVELINKVSGAMAGVTTSLMQGDAAAKQLQGQLNKVQSLYSSGLMMAGAGVTLAAPLVIAVKEAMKLETAIKRVQVATLSSTQQMAGFSEMLSEVAHQTAIFSKADLAGMAAGMASSGIRNMADIKKLLPLFAKGADVLKLTTGESPETSVHTMAALAHQFGRFSTSGKDDMTPLVNAAVALSTSIPGGMKGFATMGSYVNTLGSRIMKIDPVDLMVLQATAMQTSGGGGAGARGALSGNNIANVLSRIIPGVMGSGLFSGKSSYALSALGIRDDQGRSTVFKDGVLSISELARKLEGTSELANSASGRVELAQRMLKFAPMLGKKAPETIEFANRVIASGGSNVAPAEMLMPLFRYAFGSGDKFAAIFSDPKFQSQLLFNQEKVKKAIAGGGINTMQEELMQVLHNRLAQLETDTKTLFATIGTQAIPMLSAMALKIDGFVVAINKFAEQHPRLVQAGVALTALASSALILGGAALITRAGFMGLNLIWTPLQAGLTTALPWLAKLGPLFLRLTPQTAALGLAIGGVGLAIANWDKITGFLHQHIDLIKGTVGLFAHELDFVRKIWSSLTDAFKVGANAFMSFGTSFAGVINNSIDWINKVGHFSLPRMENWLGDAEKAYGRYGDSELRKYGGSDIASALDRWANQERPIVTPIARRPSNNASKASSVHVDVGGIHIHAASADPHKVADQVLRKLTQHLGQAIGGTVNAGGTSFSSYQTAGGAG